MDNEQSGSPATQPPLPDAEPFAKPPKLLPFAKRYPILAGALLGVLLRLAFSGSAGSSWSAMAGAFIFLVPLFIGMVTVYLAERQRRRSWGYYLGAPFVGTTLFVVGTMVIMIEGVICAIVIIPMFAVLGSLGGLVMGITCRLTNWPKPMVYSFGVLPLLLGAFGGQLPVPDNFGQIERSIHVAAPPAAVWAQLHSTMDIRPDEVGHGWAYRIGVPLPLSGVMHDTPQGKVRKIAMGKGVHFDGVVQEWQPERYVRWTYRFHLDSFPPGALDDHVLIGGHYFDLIDTAYELVPTQAGTQLTVRIKYRVSTQFNLYADWVAQSLLGNFGDVAIDFYRRRSEAGMGGAAVPAQPSVDAS
jgi:hypothetical protein